MPSDSLSIKSTWDNNSSSDPHPQAKFINNIWRLDMRPKIQLFPWKLIPDIIPTRAKLQKLGLPINGDCPFCNKS